MGLVATITSEAEPESDSEDENEICIRAKEKQRSWYLDSGCSSHMTGEKSMFLTLAMKEGGNVKFGGNQCWNKGCFTISDSLVLMITRY